MDKQNSAFQRNKELEEKIRGMICGIYGSKFLKNIAVKYDGESYQLRLHVHDNMWCPMVMSIQTNDEDTFLEYIKKELNSRQLQMSEHIEVSLEDFDNKHGYF